MDSDLYYDKTTPKDPYYDETSPYDKTSPYYDETSPYYSSLHDKEDLKTTAYYTDSVRTTTSSYTYYTKAENGLLTQSPICSCKDCYDKVCESELEESNCHGPIFVGIKALIKPVINSNEDITKTKVDSIEIECDYVEEL